MRWHNDYTISISTLDAQHKHLFATLSDLQEALKQGLRPSAITTILEKLHVYVIRHFNLEEKYMQESGYPGLEEQQQAHSTFTGTFKEIENQFETEGLTSALVNRVKTELEDWLRNHVLVLDKQFGAFYQDHKRHLGPG